MSLQGITEYKERIISSSYDASLTSGLQNIYQTQYSLDNPDMTKYLKNYYLTNEGMSAIVDSDNNIKSFVSSASLHISQLWILDDSTSAVDTATDAKIRSAFKSEIPDTTKIIIAQRISSVQDADKIVVLDDGKIDAIGTHDELKVNNAIYREVYESQVKGADDNE